MIEYWRQIHCPICGAELRVEVANGGQFPEVHVLPPHTPAKAVNLCAGTRITVTIDWDRCRECGEKFGGHPSGLCMRCYKRAGRQTQATR